MSQCRCGAEFTFIGYGKRLCPPCMTRYKQRRANSLAAPKCGCGAVLGLRKQEAGITQCSRCDRIAVQRNRQEVLDDLADFLLRIERASL